ncbi:MAG: FtsH protease activity modulator HflK [Candidatus Coatesbacteria bacterium]|nr:FtsH protease activity modulator HflK [Candidatus Coatesbacteria bacterium]
MAPQDFDLRKMKVRGRKGDDFEINLSNMKMPKVRIAWIVLAALAIWILSGFYMVSPGEQGVIRRFGAYARSTVPGLRYHLPFPMEVVDKVSLTEVRRIEVGFRTINGVTHSVQRESHMLTGDENIVNVTMIVQYLVHDARDYLFNVKDQEGTVRDATESALRQIIGIHSIDDVLTAGKQQIQDETITKLEELLGSYELGVHVTAVQLQDVHPPQEVIHAFKDVASAKEDKNKFINKAHGYRNEIIPQAKGEAARMVRKAEGEKVNRIRRAEGDVQKFLKTLEKYRAAKAITRQRLYIETMEAVLPAAKKIILSDTGQVSLLNLLSNDFKTLPTTNNKGAAR